MTKKKQVRMKLHFILAFLSISAFFDICSAQKSTDNLYEKNLECDSIVFLNGEVVTCQIQEIRKKKVIYFLCCPQCLVPREFYIKEIDTIIRSKSLNIKKDDLETTVGNNEESPTNMALDSSSLKPHLNIQILMIRKKSKNKKNEIIAEGQRLKIKLINGDVLKGKLNFSPSNQILIGNEIIELEDVVCLTKNSKGWRIAGGITGSAATLTTLWLSGFSLPVVFIPISATFFGLMIMNRKYNFTKKYEVYHLY